MSVTTVQIGTKAQLQIDDDGSNNVTFRVYFPWTDSYSYDEETGAYEYTGDRGEVVMEEFPWSITINGEVQGLRSSVIRKAPDNYLGTFWSDKSQTVTLHIGETNNGELGGPLDYSFYLQRADVLGVSYVTVGNVKRRAIPFVNVAGVWRRAEPYSKYAGDWKQTT